MALLQAMNMEACSFWLFLFLRSNSGVYPFRDREYAEGVMRKWRHPRKSCVYPALADDVLRAGSGIFKA